MNELRTDQALLRALERASSRSPSQAELAKQRISFIMGSLSQDSSMTREQVEGVLSRQEGRKRA
jgi:hypothetical protein